MSAETLLYTPLFYFILLYSAIFHECAHAISAYKLGDPTAYLSGRITLNPVKHISLFYTLIMPLVTYFAFGIPFGGAKPVPINPYNFRDANKGMMISSLAGPFTNFILAIIGFCGFFLAVRVFPLSGFALHINIVFFFAIIAINILLGIFNLIPIPPLDGSRILRYFLPWHMKETLDRIEPFGLMIVLAFILMGGTAFLGKILVGIIILLIKIAPEHTNEIIEVVNKLLG